MKFWLVVHVTSMQLQANTKTSECACQWCTCVMCKMSFVKKDEHKSNTVKDNLANYIKQIKIKTDFL